MRMRSRKIFLPLVLLILSSTSTFTQQPAAGSNTIEARARNLTEALAADALALNRSDRAMLYARLGQAWSKHDPQLARTWFLRAVETVEAPPVSKTEEVCQRTSARTLLGLIADREKALTDRLIAIIETSNHEPDQADRLENAHALANAGISIANSDPKAARVLAEKSLALAFSYRLASLLWRIQKTDSNEGDKLFLHLLALARARTDYNLFSMLSIAVLNGPFPSEKYRNLLVSSLAHVIAQKEQGGNNDALFCDPIPLLPPLLPDFDRLLPEFSQRARANVSRCRQARYTSGKADQNDAPDVAVPRTIDELLKAARDAGNPLDRSRYFSHAVGLAAQKKDFDRALNILDSMDEADKDVSRGAWESWRWDYAASAACKYRTNDDFSGMNKVIDNTPPNLRAFVRIVLSDCEALSSQEEKLNLLASARKELEKAEPSQQSIWYMTLVRKYAKQSPDTAPEIISQAVLAINRAAKEQKYECPTSTTTPTVLGNQILLDQHKLPASLMDVDEAGVLDTISSVQPADSRAAFRLQLLRATLEQRQIPKTQKPPSAGNRP